MEELTVKKNDALAQFEAAGNKTKKVLINLFGEKPFVKNIMLRIQSLQDALDYNGKTLERFNWETERDTDQQRADKEWEEICLALREGKELEMGAKWYYPYALKPTAGSGSGFSYSVCIYGDASSCVGARHSVDTSEKAIYMGKQFISILTRRFSPKSK